MTILPADLSKFHRIHRGVRIRNELAGLVKRRRKHDGRRTESGVEATRLDQDIAERKADEDYRYLLELERVFALGGG